MLRRASIFLFDIVQTLDMIIVLTFVIILFATLNDDLAIHLGTCWDLDSTLGSLVHFEIIGCKI